MAELKFKQKNSLSSQVYVHVGFPAYKELELSALVSRGYQVLIIDDLGIRPPEHCFHTYIFEKSRDIHTLSALVRGFCAETQLKLAAFFTMAEGSVEVVNDLCREFSLPEIFSLSLPSIRDKFEMRRRMLQKGYEIPILLKILPQDPIPELLESDFPVIVKPIDSLDSRSVSKVNSNEELRLACQKVFTGQTQLPGDMGLITVEKAYGLKPHAVVETYVEGYEYSVEVIVIEGAVKHRFVTLKRNSGAPFFYEHGHTQGLNPLTQDESQQLDTLISKLIEANEYRSTILHIEFRVTAGHRVFMIECNSRLCGDQISDLVEKAYGINMLDAFFRYYAGEKDIACNMANPKLVTRYYLTSEAEGTLVRQAHTCAGFKINWWK